MPIRQVPRNNPSKKLLAALLLPAWLQMQSHPTGSVTSLKAGLRELEKTLED